MDRWSNHCSAARHMRLLSFLFVVTGCGAEVLPIEGPASVRERLDRGPASFVVDGAASAGAITAERNRADGWSAGLVELAIERGDFVVAVDPHGLEIAELALEVGPIEVPDTVLGYSVQLTDIRITLAEPVRVDAAWSSDDDARGDTELPIVLAWSLVNHGTKAPLGAPDLPAVPAELVLAGNGSGVTAELRVNAPGELWSWADLIRLQDLTLILTARDH
jgi:hypothetical protein